MADRPGHIAAREKLGEAIEAYVHAMAAVNEDQDPGTVIGWVVGIGLQRLDEDLDVRSALIFDAQHGTDLFHQRGLAEATAEAFAEQASFSHIYDEDE